MVNFVYLIGDRSTGEAVVVDPAYAVQDLLDIVAADGMQLTGVLGTHFHPDHLGGTMGGWSLEGIERAAREGPGADPRPGRRGAVGRAHHGRRARRPGRARQRRRRAGGRRRGGAHPHARPHAGQPVLPRRRPPGRGRHALPRGLRPDRLPGLGPARHVRVDPHPARPRPRRRHPLSRATSTPPSPPRAWGRPGSGTTSSGPAPRRSGWPCSAAEASVGDGTWNP